MEPRGLSSRLTMLLYPLTRRSPDHALGYQQAPAERVLREPYLAAARSRLEEAAWKTALAEGQAMTFEAAVSYALEEEEAGG